MQDKNEIAEAKLTAAERGLEDALRSLRPAPAQLDAAAAALEARRRAASRRMHAWQAAAAAAVLVTALAWRAFSPRGEAPGLARQQTPAVPARATIASVTVAIEPPMLLAYHRALMQSPEELDAVLDRQAGSGGGRGRQAIPVGTLRSWDANLQSSLKEM